MINKISAVVAAALIIGSASVASAATAHKVLRHRAPQGQLMLLENARGPAAKTNAATNFQNNWDVSY